jgi:hypothetical protein
VRAGPRHWPDVCGWAYTGGRLLASVVLKRVDIMATAVRSRRLTRDVVIPPREGRYRRVLRPGEVPHAWANRTQPEGRCSNLFFRGATIYSYGTHFPVARHVERDGRPFILFTTRSYSVTTSGHCHAVRGAIAEGSEVYRVENVLADTYAEHNQNLVAGRGEVALLLAHAQKARTRAAEYLERAQERVGELNQYASRVGLAGRVTVDPEELEKQIEEHRRKISADERRRERDRAAALAAEVADWEQKVKAWQDGGPLPGYIPDSRHPLATMTFLRIKGKVVETSLRMAVPLRAVLPILAAVRRADAELPGFKVGDYMLSEIDRESRVVRIGCHRISFDEIERLAARHGL